MRVSRLYDTRRQRSRRRARLLVLLRATPGDYRRRRYFHNEPHVFGAAYERIDTTMLTSDCRQRAARCRQMARRLDFAFHKNFMITSNA